MLIMILTIVLIFLGASTLIGIGMMRAAGTRNHEEQMLEDLDQIRYLQLSKERKSGETA